MVTKAKCVQSPVLRLAAAAAAAVAEVHRLSMSVAAAAAAAQVCWPPLWLVLKQLLLQIVAFATPGAAIAPAGGHSSCYFALHAAKTLTLQYQALLALVALRMAVPGFTIGNVGLLAKVFARTA